MFCVLEPIRSRSWPRAAVLALMAIGVAACSGEATRFGDNSQRANPDATGSIPQGQVAPVGKVESRPLPPQSAQLPPPQSGASAPSTVAASPGVAGGGRGMASYSPPPAPSQHAPSTFGAAPSYSPGTARPVATTPAEVTGSVAVPRPAPAAAPSGNWTW